MALVTSEKAWGIAVTINTATAADNIVVGCKKPTKLCSIICGGAATTDIITVKDGDSNLIWQGCALVGQSDYLTIPSPTGKTFYGILVGFAGATTGWCNLVYSDA